MMMSDTTPLLNVLRACTTEEQCEFAELARTTRNYLYQIATLRRSPGVALAKRICDASNRLHVLSLGRIPKISIDQLAAMASYGYGVESVSKEVSIT